MFSLLLFLFVCLLFVLLFSKLVMVICSTTKGYSFVLHYVLWFVLCVFCVFVLCDVGGSFNVLCVVVFVLRLCVLSVCVWIHVCCVCACVCFFSFVFFCSFLGGDCLFYVLLCL